MAHPRPPVDSRLLNLPQELQDKIQEDVFDDNFTIDSDYRAPALLRALRTCSEQGILKRAVDTFYKTATFEVHEDKVVGWLQSRRPAHGKLIRNMHVRLEEEIPLKEELVSLTKEPPKKPKDVKRDPAVQAFLEERLIPIVSTFDAIQVQHFLDALRAVNVQGNLVKALELSTALHTLRENIEDAGVDVNLDTIKVKLGADCGDYIWTNEPEAAMRPFLLSIGYALETASEESEEN